MSTKAGLRKFVETIENQGLRTVRDDFRGKFRPHPKDSFSGTAYRILDDEGNVLPLLDNSLTADDILERDSFYGIFEFAHRG